VNPRRGAGTRPAVAGDAHSTHSSRRRRGSRGVSCRPCTRARARSSAAVSGVMGQPTRRAIVRRDGDATGGASGCPQTSSANFAQGDPGSTVNRIFSWGCGGFAVCTRDRPVRSPLCGVSPLWVTACTPAAQPSGRPATWSSEDQPAPAQGLMAVFTVRATTAMCAPGEPFLEERIAPRSAQSARRRHESGGWRERRFLRCASTSAYAHLDSCRRRAMRPRAGLSSARAARREL
jgi:hypothetical protein